MPQMPVAKVKALVSAHADVNAKNSRGDTALALAIYGDYTEIVKLLKAAGAKA